jgi:trigger factor
MQVTETLSDGLKRSYKVLLPVDDLAKRLDDQLNDMKNKVQIKGFRPGKVPVAHLKKVYGKSVMADVLQNAVNEVNRKIIDENGLKLAGEPKIDIDGGDQGVEKAIAVEGDLAFTVNLEVLPKFEVGEFADVSLEREVVEVSDAEVDDALKGMADQSRPYDTKDGAAAKGDKVTIDFAGKIDDVAFEGGTGNDMDVVLGSNSFIPGFEEQLEGIKAGESRVLNVKFPEGYQAAHLAGKDATFDVTAKKIEAPGEVAIDDEFAKKFGLDSLDKLKDAIRADIGRQYQGVSREKLKRTLFDQLNGKYTFELPETLVEQEFNNVWQQVEGERRQSGKSFEDEGTTEEAARADYRKIAERRVRLGLVLAQVGEEAKVEVTDDELTQAIVARARQYPGQEKAIWDFYRNNPQQVASIRAPLFEEKVVDIIIGKAKVADKTVSKEELMKVEEAEAAA